MAPFFLYILLLFRGKDRILIENNYLYNFNYEKYSIFIAMKN